MERMPKPTMPMERIGPPAEPGRRITLADRWDYTVAELRALCRAHGIPGRSRMTHDQLVAALRDAGVDLPAKAPQRR